jgi:hypothetical protein
MAISGAPVRDGKKSPKGAIDDYVTAIEPFGNKDRIKPTKRPLITPTAYWD